MGVYANTQPHIPDNMVVAMGDLVSIEDQSSHQIRDSQELTHEPAEWEAVEAAESLYKYHNAVCQVLQTVAHNQSRWASLWGNRRNEAADTSGREGKSG